MSFVTGRLLRAFLMQPGTAIGWPSESSGDLPVCLVSRPALSRLKNDQRGEPPRRGRGAAGPRGSGGRRPHVWEREARRGSAGALVAPLRGADINAFAGQEVMHSPRADYKTIKYILEGPFYESQWCVGRRAAVCGKTCRGVWKDVPRCVERRAPLNVGTLFSG